MLNNSWMIVAACQVIISCATGHFRVIRNCAAIMTLRCGNAGGSREQGARKNEGEISGSWGGEGKYEVKVYRYHPFKKGSNSRWEQMER